MPIVIGVILAIAVLILASSLLSIAKEKKRCTSFLCSNSRRNETNFGHDRCCFKPSTSVQVAYSISGDVAEMTDPSAEHAYENIIGMRVNQQPVYAEVNFKNGPGEQRTTDQQPIYANVSKTSPKNNILSTPLSTSDVVYASIRN